MLDGQPQPPRARRTEHQPVGAAGKVFVVKRVAEHRVVDAEVVDIDPALGDAGAAAGLEDVDRPIGIGLGNPAPHRAAAEPFVLEGPSLARSAKQWISSAGPNRAAPHSRARRACRSPDRNARRRTRGPRRRASRGHGPCGQEDPRWRLEFQRLLPSFMPFGRVSRWWDSWNSAHHYCYRSITFFHVAWTPLAGWRRAFRGC